MLAKVLSGALLGIDAYPVEVEVDIAQGLPQFATVGLPEGAVKEAKDRIKSAVKNSGYEFPPAASPSIWPPPTSARTERPSTCRWPLGFLPPPVLCARHSAPLMSCWVNFPWMGG